MIGLLKVSFKGNIELIWHNLHWHEMYLFFFFYFRFSHKVHQNTTFCSTEVNRRLSILIQLYFVFKLGPCFDFPVLKVAMTDPLKIISCGFMISPAIILQQRLFRSPDFSTEYRLNFDPTLDRKSVFIIPMWLLLLASNIWSASS